MNPLDPELGAWTGSRGLLERTLAAVAPVDVTAADQAAARAGELAIPAGSLGRILALSVRLAAIQRTLTPVFPRKVVVVMAGDHGVVRRGVSAFPPEVTPQMVANFARGRAAINALAGSAGARVLVADVGVAVDLPLAVGLRPVASVAEALVPGAVLHRKVCYGTDDMSSRPAMTREQATAALEAGIDVVEGLVAEGVDLVATGDMGIGNTTSSSALACVFTGRMPREVTGRGTGLDDPALERKRQVVEEALARHRPDSADPVGALAAVGGLEIAGIAGVILGAAAAGIPVLVDGFISTAGALVACALAPPARDYLIAAHRSLEPGHQVMLEHLNVDPLLDLDLRLGEGTGAALAMPLVDGAAALLGTMATFAEAGVSESIVSAEVATSGLGARGGPGAADGLGARDGSDPTVPGRPTWPEAGFWPREGGITTVQDIEDLATAAWLSQTLFAALELGVFDALGEDVLALDQLARRCGADLDGCGRLVDALVSLGLLTRHGGSAAGEAGATQEVVVACATVARRHLLRGAPGYLGSSLAYRRRLASTWTRLADAVRCGGSPLEQPAGESEAGYRARVRDYLLAMDDVARHKGALIVDRLDPAALAPGCLVDLGGGAGAIAAEILRRSPTWRGVVLDMPEVVGPAREEWRTRAAAGGDHSAGGRLDFVACNLLEEEIPAPPEGGPGWGLVVASNVLHAYAAADAGPLLDRAARALSDTGLLLVHDFFTDGPGRGPVKSALFDLHMMINTYQGRTYPWSWVRDRLEAQGLAVMGPISLGGGRGDEDTALMAAARRPETLAALRADRLEVLDGLARDLGFRGTAPIRPEEVMVAPWVGTKCRFGCALYGKGAQCPPRSPRAEDTRALLASYSRALLVEGEPPTAEFHRRMLALERAAFLGGAPRALVFVAGPCCLCPDCEPDECRRPAEARPSMEAAGIDVYATAAAVGRRLDPAPDRESPATYVGLLLVE